MSVINLRTNPQYGRCKMYIIGDVHGCLDTLKALLDQLPDWKTKRVAFVGDLIDRGPKSRQVVEFVMDLCEKDIADCVKGNHEDMMVDYAEFGKNAMWIGNGGQQCLDSYFEKPEPTHPINDPESDEYVPGLYLKGIFNNKVFQRHADWMDLLPAYIEYKDLKKDGRHLVVSHSHISPLWAGIRDNPPDTLDWDGINAAIMWGRPKKFDHAVQNLEIFNVIGHTPREKARIRSFYANIDSGCFYLRERAQGNYGHLTALDFPSMTLYTQRCIDEVNW
jgi:serine/threonine protein phosphatase 1